MSYALQSRWAIYVRLLVGFAWFCMFSLLSFSIRWNHHSTMNESREKKSPNVFSFVIIYAMWFATFETVVFTHFILYVFIFYTWFVCIWTLTLWRERERATKNESVIIVIVILVLQKLERDSFFLSAPPQKQSENSWRAKCMNAMEGGGQRKGWKWQRK